MNETQVARMAEQIEWAYNLVKSEPRAWVSLTRIAEYIDAPREVIWEAYRLLNRRSDVNVIPEENQKVLRQIDWDCAAWLGGQWRHLIAIGI